MPDSSGLTLLQRLSGDPRYAQATPADALTWAVEAILRSRRRPLPQRWQPAARDGGEPGVGSSVLNFGIPPVENWRLANELHQNELAAEVERALGVFEPRIRVREVSVKVSAGDQAQTEDPGAWNDQIVLRIQAEWKHTGAKVELEAGWGIEEHRVWFRRHE